MFSINYEEEYSKANKHLLTGDRKQYIDICLNVIKWLNKNYEDQSVQYENPRWLRNDDFSVDDIPLKIYTENALTLSHNVSNYIYKILKYDVTRRNTVVPFEEFQIQVDMRRLITVYRFPPSKQVKVCDLFEPINRKIWNTTSNSECQCPSTRYVSCIIQTIPRKLGFKPN